MCAVVDAATLRITLTRPTPYLLGLAAHSTWLPVHRATIEKYGKIDERGTAWTRPGNLVGNGPFTLTEWQPNARLIVAKNPLYWGAATNPIARVIFYPTEKSEVEELTFRAGQLPRGARGATGPAGPTFSFGYSEYSTESLTYGSDPTYLVSRDIVVPRAGRMTLNFTGSFTRPLNAGVPESFDCHMQGPDGAELAPLTTSGLVGPEESASIAITGSFVAAAGTNRIYVRCALTPGTGSATINVYGHSITGVLTDS